MYKNIFLLGIDLEDTSYEFSSASDRHSFEVAVNKYVQFLADNKMHATFFVLGKTAKRYPQLITTIYNQGNEIACHSYSHTPLTRMTRELFIEDLKKQVNELRNLGIKNIIGYRAPCLSVIESTSWVYEVLYTLGFKYSSSVLPAKNAYYGYATFFQKPTKIYKNLIEFPISLNTFKYPIGGVYFRFFPYFMTSLAIKRQLAKNNPIVSYIHPYDNDNSHRVFNYPELRNTFFIQWLMQYNRKSVIPKLIRIIRESPTTIMTYSQYIELNSPLS